MIAVKILLREYSDGSPVDFETIDWDSEHAPVLVFGPFESISRAVEWMEFDYPDDDADVYDMAADNFDIPEDWHVNDPSRYSNGLVVEGEFPDEDIRDDSREIHVL